MFKATALASSEGVPFEYASHSSTAAANAAVRAAAAATFSRSVTTLEQRGHRGDPHRNSCAARLLTSSLPVNADRDLLGGLAVLWVLLRVALALVDDP